MLLGSVCRGCGFVWPPLLGEKSPLLTRKWMGIAVADLSYWTLNTSLLNMKVFSLIPFPGSYRTAQNTPPPLLATLLPPAVGHLG